MYNPFLKENLFLASQFELSICTFTDLLPVLLKSTPSSLDPTFGFTFKYDDLLKIAFVNTIKPKSPYSNIFSNHRSNNNKLRGNLLLQFVVSVSSPLMMP